MIESIISNRPLAKTLFSGWIVMTVMIAASFIAIYLGKGIGAFDLIVQDPKLSDLTLTIIATVIIWLLAGFFTSLLFFEVFTHKNLYTYAGFFLISILYVNILRERMEYGDLGSYLQSAASLHESGTLPNGYIYPLLWAAILAAFAPYGTDAMFLFAWCLNIGALFAFYFLLVKTLEKYGFTTTNAAFVTTFFMLVNVPLLRTLIYGQVNLIVLNGIMLALIAYHKSPFWSALGLTLAVQFKISPIVLIAAILLEFNWRWLAWFAFHMLVLTAVPILIYGTEPYNDILRNLGTLDARTYYYFRDTSFDSFFISTFTLLKLDPLSAQIWIYISKAFLAAGVLYTAYININNKTFFNRESGRFFFNAIPTGMVFLTLASPLVWEHHGIFLSLSFLLLLPFLKTNTHWILFISAYCFEFFLPTFDIYPWSFIRLAAPLMVLWLIWNSSPSAGTHFLAESMKQT